MDEKTLGTVHMPRRVHDWELWQQRYVALDGMIGTLQGQLDKSVSREETFAVLLQKLREFAGAQFCFLYNGLDPRRGDDRCLEPSLQYPDDFVLEATLDQIAFDLTVLQGAWYQRVLAKDNSAMARTLEIADQLAYYALLPALRYELLPFEEGQVTVLTYFQKAPHIRMIPYASVALVGIPYTTLSEYSAQPLEKEAKRQPCRPKDDGERGSPETEERADTAGEAGTGVLPEVVGLPQRVGNARDLLSIPHEIGHYVYQHGSSSTSRLQHALYEALQGQPEWLHNWAEEIFADVYGVLIAGPVIVRDFQDLMKDNDLVSLLSDDNEHPTPVLRPLLYVDALKLLADKTHADEKQKRALRKIAKEAKGRWNKFRVKRGEDHIEERRKIIEEAVNTAFGMLTKGKPVPADDLWSLPSLGSTAREQYDSLYEEFYRDVTAEDNGLFERLRRTMLDGRPAGSRVQRVPPDLDKDWDTPLQKIPTLQWLDRIRQSLEGCSGTEARIPTEVWTLVVSMNGWATNGPEEAPNPKIT